MLSSIKEWLRYEKHSVKALFYPLLWIANHYYRRKGCTSHLNFLAGIFRLNWPGTSRLVSHEIKKNYLDRNALLRSEIYSKILDDFQPLQRYAKFSENPTKLLDGIVTVMAPRTVDAKGVLVIAYSYYFLMFLKYFDMKIVLENYHVVLEPSWNGLCEASILAYTKFDLPVFVMAYEDRDYTFLKNLKTNLVPLKLSANWWVSPAQFKQGKQSKQRDIDVIMVAAWAKFKRHDKFFKAIREINKKGRNLKVTLVGYPNDLKLEDIVSMADTFGVTKQIDFKEKISPEKVAELLGRAKVNIVWSRFEGVNRAIIEGMFCDTPCILREGFNFGMQYPYVNEQTGCFSSEHGLSQKIIDMVDNMSKYSPRDYVMKHHNCFLGAELLGREIAKVDEQFDWRSVVPKLSGLDGMTYVSVEDRNKCKEDYKELVKACLKKE